MNDQHLTEPEIQQAADNPELLCRAQEEHFIQCVNCQLKVDNYRAIAGGLAHMKSSAFDFDLSAQVMAALPPKKVPYSLIPAFAAGLGALLIAVMVVVFGNRINSFLAAMSASLLYLAIIPALVLLVLQLVLTYRDHQRKMNNLINS